MENSNEQLIQPKLSNKALKAATDAALKTVGRAVVIYSTRPECRSWEAIGKAIGIVIPEWFSEQPCSIDSIRNSWGRWYIDSIASRLKASAAGEGISNIPVKAEVVSAKEITDCETFGDFTLAPEQQAVYQAIIRDTLISPKNRAILENDGTGAGKMVVGCAIINHILSNKLYGDGFFLHQILIFCPKGIQETWCRHLEKSGHGRTIGNEIMIVPYSQLSSTYGDALVLEKYDPYDDNKPPDLEWNPAMLPYAALFDECHKLNNEQTRQTNAILALLTSSYRKPLSFWFSATPFVTVNNARAFCIAAEVPIEALGTKVNKKNFVTFAGLITNEPAKPNEAAMDRLKKILAPYTYSMPRVKWPHKAINSVILVDFRSDKDRNVYFTAQQRYIEKCEILGQNVNKGRFLQWIALGQYRKAVEPIRAEQMIEKCDEHIQSGKAAPVIGCAFRDTIIKSVFQLIKLGYKREDISIIWGGKKQVQEDLVLSPNEFKELVDKTLRGEDITKEEIKRLEVTIAFKESKISYQEDDDEETKERHRMLTKFGISGTQSASQRQNEIDRFQGGKSKICLLTAAAGGIGLSLDHWVEYLLPRIGFFTPLYSGPEFKQLLGRLVRRFTLSDTYQFIVGMKGTIEETHVMPIIDKKLRCIAKITNRDYEIIDFHKAKIVDLSIRDIATAEKDSENEESQIQNAVTEIEDIEDNEEPNGTNGE